MRFFTSFRMTKNDPMVLSYIKYTKKFLNYKRISFIIIIDIGEKRKDRSSHCYWSFKTAVECLRLLFLYFLKPAKNIRLLSLYLNTMIGYQEVSFMSSILWRVFQNFCKFVFPCHTEAEGQRISFFIF
jgi:hypothetical protein